MNMPYGIHKDLIISGRWFKLSLAEQMANIGADVGRAIQWRIKGDLQASRDALNRAFELIDLTVATPKNKGHLKAIAIIFILVLFATGYGNAVAEDGISKERQGTFEEIIQPWIKGWFVNHAIEVSLSDDAKIERKLISSSLIKFENINGEERYSVNIIYHVVISDGPSDIVLHGLKEQQIVFLLNGDDLIDYFPFDEYWKEKPLQKMDDLQI